MSGVIQVDDTSFEKEVLKSESPVLVEFGAAWCGPCQRQLPVLEKLVTEYADKLVVAKIDIDDALNISAKYGIKSVPTLILFKGGEKIDTKIGLTSLVDVRALLSKVDL